MADIATALISGAFALVGSLGSIWLKDYLERRRQAPPSQYGSPGTRPPAMPSAPPAPSAATSRLRPIFVALFGFAVGTVSSFVRPMFPPPTHPEAIVSLGLLALVVLASIAHHARPAPGRGLALFELETLSLWAAYTFGWSLVHGSLWSDFVFAVVIAWLISAVAGLLILPLVRRTSKRPANP